MGAVVQLCAPSEWKCHLLIYQWDSLHHLSSFPGSHAQEPGGLQHLSQQLPKGLANKTDIMLHMYIYMP